MLETTGQNDSPPRRRQQEVLETAARVFHEKGFESTSIQDIADAVGILKGSLYYYIRSKDDLLYDILRSVHEDALADIAAIDEMDGDAHQRIRAFVVRHLTFNAKNLTRMGVFFHDFGSLDSTRQREISASRDVYEGKLKRLIREAQKEQTVCPDIDAAIAAKAIMGMLNWIYQWYRPRGPLTISDLAAEFADFVLASLVCTPETHTPGHRAALHALPVEFAAVA